MFMAAQQQMMPFGGGGFGGGGFGMSPVSGGFGADPMGTNHQMMALGQQQQMFGAMMNQMMMVMSMVVNMMMMRQMQAMMSSSPGFGGSGGGGGTPGLGNFLGGGGGGGGSPSAGSVGGSPAPAATTSDFGSVPAWGAALARDAEKNANGPGGWCFRWVRQALERAGVKGVGGASAYMAADQLARNPRFREIKVAPKDLTKLPAGAVVVWNRGNGHEHGHISIALGNGREASDKIRPQTVNYGTSVRVFLPK